MGCIFTYKYGIVDSLLSGWDGPLLLRDDPLLIRDDPLLIRDDPLLIRENQVTSPHSPLFIRIIHL